MRSEADDDGVHLFGLGVDQADRQAFGLATARSQVQRQRAAHDLALWDVGLFGSILEVAAERIRKSNVVLHGHLFSPKEWFWGASYTPFRCLSYTRGLGR